MNEGKIVQIIGPVVDVDFEAVEHMPEIFDALELDFSVDGASHHLVFEVQQHLGDGVVRAIAMSSTEGLKRGMTLQSPDSPITVPVAEGVLGRVFNVTGDPGDERGRVKFDMR